MNLILNVQPNKMNKNSYCVIMAGGLGKRFWPVSTKACPKQFCDILNVGKSFLRQTFERANQIFDTRNIFIVTGSAYEELTKQQIPEIPTENILKEPFGKNTAPCVAYAAYRIARINPHASMVVVPSDHFITNDVVYLDNIQKGISFVEQSGGLLTIGIKPTRPETGYGYIAAGDPIMTDKEIFTVDAFKEKPDRETADRYLAEGGYFWNAGIFVWNVRTITSVMRVYAPGIAQIFDRIFPDFYTEKENETIKKLFPTCEAISIDYAVMEKAQEIYVLPASFGWSDLGTWGALRGLLPQDKSGNATVGPDVRLYESKNCIVHTSEEKRVVIQGLDGYIIAEKDQTLLICKLDEEQRIKEFSK